LQSVVGLPRGIRTDNGVPFATSKTARTSGCTDANVEGGGHFGVGEALVRFQGFAGRVRLRAPRVPARTIWVKDSRSAALRLALYVGGAIASLLAEDATVVCLFPSCPFSKPAAGCTPLLAGSRRLRAPAASYELLL